MYNVRSPVTPYKLHLACEDREMLPRFCPKFKGKYMIKKLPKIGDYIKLMLIEFKPKT